MNIEVSYLETDNGPCPYLKWERELDPVARAAGYMVTVNHWQEYQTFLNCESI